MKIWLWYGYNPRSLSWSGTFIAAIGDLTEMRKGFANPNVMHSSQIFSTMKPTATATSATTIPVTRSLLDTLLTGTKRIKQNRNIRVLTTLAGACCM